MIIYNFFAFAFQVPLGYILDKFKVYKYISIIGLCLIGLCYLINFNAYLLAMVVGIGNALFHLEGGVNIYSVSEKKAFLNGLFVAPGALGIFLGTMFYGHTTLATFLIFLAICLLFFVQKQEVIMKEDLENKLDNSRVLLIVIFIGLSIIVRSILGIKVVYSWKNTFVLGLIYAISMVLGKALGGFLADRLGLLKVALGSFFLSAICLVLGYNIHMFAYIGILLFNMPMAITLTILENTLSKKIACAVGLNTMFLFIGFLIGFINITINNFILVGSVMFAMLAFFIAYKLYLKGEFSNEKN